MVCTSNSHGYDNLKSIYYFKPGLPFSFGLKIICDEKTTMNMIACLIEHGSIDIYIEHEQDTQQYYDLVRGVCCVEPLLILMIPKYSCYVI